MRWREVGAGNEAAVLHEAVKSEAALGRHVRCLPQDPVGARHGRHPPSLLLPRVGPPLFLEVDAGQCASGSYSSRGDQEGTYGVCTLKGPLRSCPIRFEQEDYGVISNAICEISLFKDAQHPNMVKTYERRRIANDSTYWVLFQLIWRDYLRFLSAKYGNSIFLQVFSACLEKWVNFHKKEVKGAKGASRKENATGTTSHVVPLEGFTLEELWWPAIALGKRRGCLSKRLQGLEEDGREQFCGTLVNVRV